VPHYKDRVASVLIDSEVRTCPPQMLTNFGIGTLADRFDEGFGSLVDIGPQPIGDGPVRHFAPPRRDDLGRTASEVFAGNVEETFLAQILIDEEFRHMSPAHALQDQLSFHELIAYGPAAGAFDHKIIARGPRRFRFPKFRSKRSSIVLPAALTGRNRQECLSLRILGTHIG